MRDIESTVYENKVSIILPSFNVVQYIGECIESVMNQTLKEIEIICVDAGSEDGTYEMISAYSRMDKRIKVIRTDKKSYGYQVNLGIKEARGEYIALVETDDFVDAMMYERLYEIAKKSNIDCVKSDHFTVTGEGEYKKTRIDAFPEKQAYLYNCILDRSRMQERFCANLYTWSGIYRRSYIVKNEIRHNETPGASYQDNGFWFQTMMYADKVLFIHEAFYHLRRDNPKSSFFDSKKYIFLKKEYDFIHDVIRKSNFNHAEKHLFYELCFRYRFISYCVYSKKVQDDDFPDLYFLMRNDTLIALEQGEISLFGIKEIDDYLVKVIHLDSPIRVGMTSAYWKRAWDRMQVCDRIFIYGAGKIGKRVKDMLDSQYNLNVPYSFVVTQKDEMINHVNGLPVEDIESIDGKRRCFVIVAVAEKTKNEIFTLLKEKGIDDYCYYKDIWF